MAPRVRCLKNSFDLKAAWIARYGNSVTVTYIRKYAVCNYAWSYWSTLRNSILKSKKNPNFEDKPYAILGPH